MIAPRFGDIFRGNSHKAGLLTVVLPEKIVQRLWDDIEDDPKTEVTVDVVDTQVRAGERGEVHDFELDDYTRWRLMEGLDDIGITMRTRTRSTAYEQASQAVAAVRHGPEHPLKESNEKSRDTADCVVVAR